METGHESEQQRQVQHLLAYRCNYDPVLLVRGEHLLDWAPYAGGPVAANIAF